jgi:hypothetical protein
MAMAEICGELEASKSCPRAQTVDKTEVKRTAIYKQGSAIDWKIRRRICQ